MSRRKSFIISLILDLILLVGLSVMFYPIFSDWWNSSRQTRMVSSYNDAVRDLTIENCEQMFEAAHRYNMKLAQLQSPFSDYDKVPNYEGILDVSGMGIIGYITIPVIKEELPIYHGTSEAVLTIAAGHLQGSSFPVGGANTHAVISAHRGLPTAMLFTNLDKLVVGDTFTISVLNDVLTYEVEEILIVRPDEIDKLAIIPGGDYVTLMTCTPYGINTHRLLLRSHRIDTLVEDEDTHVVKVLADAAKVDPLLVVPFIAAPLVILLLISWVISSKRQRRITRKNYRKYLT